METHEQTGSLLNRNVRVRIPRFACCDQVEDTLLMQSTVCDSDSVGKIQKFANAIKIAKVNQLKLSQKMQWDL